MFLDPDPSQLPAVIQNSQTTGGQILAWLGGSIGAIGVGFLALRQYLSSNSVSTAANAAQTDLITLLRQQIEIERTRADKAEAERDKALDQISALKDQVFELTRQVQTLQGQINSMPGVTRITS